MSEIGEKLEAAVRAKAAANPDFVYKAPNAEQDPDADPTCVYVAGGAPSCLIGHGLWDLGLIDAALETVWSPSPDHWESDPNSEGVAGILGYLKLEDLTREERFWLSSVQNTQDEGVPWAEAVKQADDERRVYVVRHGS